MKAFLSQCSDHRGVWEWKLDEEPGFLARFLFTKPHGVPYRHTDTKQSPAVAFWGLWSALHSITPGILSVAFFSLSFPSWYCWRYYRRNSRPSRVCPLEGDNLSPVNCSQRGTPRESPFPGSTCELDLLSNAYPTQGAATSMSQCPWFSSFNAFSDGLLLFRVEKGCPAIRD